jgi:S1-C subfamily serine protease
MRKILLAALILAATTVVGDEKQGWLGMASTRHHDDEQHWLHVRFVVEGSPAARAGLQADDIITAIDGKAPRFRDDLDWIEFLGKIKAGQRMVFTILRKQKTMKLTVKATAMPAEYREQWKRTVEAARQRRAAGIS